MPYRVEVGDIAVLLGAGASVDAKLPTTTQLTKLLTDHFEDRNRGFGTVGTVLNFVVGLLFGQAGVQEQNPYAGVDVEKVLTAIELLAGRRDLEIAPFVFSWHPRVAELDAGPTPHRAIADIKRGLISNFDGDLERPLRLFVESVVGVGGTGQVYRNALEEITAALVDILATHGDTGYLRPLVDLGRGSDWVAVATLNYDRTIEDEAEIAGVHCSTGVETWAERGRWSWRPMGGVRLLKLHGSIDWEVEKGSSGDALAQYRIHPVGAGRRLRMPAVIFGGRNKLRAEGPFLELLAQFEEMLREARALIIVGYSFRDDHVNEILRRWINGDGARRIVVVDPSAPERDPMISFREQLKRALSGRGERAEIPAAPGHKGRQYMPAVPARIRWVKDEAISGLPVALADARSLEPWPPWGV